MENVDSQQDVDQSQQEDASLEAGFNRTRGEEPPVEIPPPEPATTEAAPEKATEASTDQQTAAPEAQAEEPMIGSFKESEFKALMAKAQRVDELEAQINGNQSKVFGKFGEVQRLINEMKATPPGQPVKLAGAKLKRLADTFPELAEALAEDLSELSLESPAQSTFDSTELEQRFALQVEEIKRENEKKLLSMKHRGWKETVKSQDFTLWKGTLPAEERQQLDNSWDAEYISDKLDSFNEWKSRPSTKQRNDKRLEAAVTPTGTPNTAPGLIPDIAGLNAGFNKIRKKT